MITKIPDSVKQELFNGTPETRRLICQERLYFAAYYFNEYFTHKIPLFHAEMYQDLQDLDAGKFKYLIWAMFRDSAKSSIGGVIDAVYDICYKKKHYIIFDAEDRGNAEQALFDITVALQSNTKLIRDFGQLYNGAISEDQKKMKRISKFITENDILVESISVYESVRGRRYKQYRPDKIVLDDFENNITKKSALKTQAVIEHINETFGALSTGATVTFLCNYISDNGSVEHLLQLAKDNPDFRVRMKAVVENGQIVWKDKFVLSDRKANELNAEIPDKGMWKKSLESIQRTLKEDYSPEMMNEPVSPTDLYFNRARIERDIASCKEPLREVGGIKVYREYDASHKYAIGADTSMGRGKDANTGIAGDFTCYPNAFVAGWWNNKVSADKAAHFLVKMARIFGECLIGPECNAESGGTCVNELKHIYSIGRIYRRLQRKEKAGDKPTEYLGWESNASTVPEMASQFRSAYNDGLIEILIPELLKEMKRFTYADLEEASKQKRGKSEATKHFDLLRAGMICWAIRLQASLTRNKAKFNQPAAVGLSEFENNPEEVMAEDPSIEQVLHIAPKRQEILPGDENEIINVRRGRRVDWQQPAAEPMSDFES